MLAMPPPQAIPHHHQPHPHQQQYQQQQQHQHQHQHQQHAFRPADSVAAAAGKEPSVEIVSLPAVLPAEAASNTQAARLADPGTSTSTSTSTSTNAPGDSQTPAPTPPSQSQSPSPTPSPASAQPASLPPSANYAHQYLEELKQEPTERRRLSKRFNPWANRNSAALQASKPSSSTPGTATHQQDQAAHRKHAGLLRDTRRPQPRVHLPTGSTASLASTVVDLDAPGRLHETRSPVVERLPPTHQPQPPAVQPPSHKDNPISPSAAATQSNAAPAGAVASGSASSSTTTDNNSNIINNSNVNHQNERNDESRSPTRPAIKPVDSGHSSKDPSIADDTASVLSGAGLATGLTGASERKMHQTSSRLLRMTDDDRPFTRDFKDLFSTLVVSLPLSQHRVRFQRIDHTFTSEEAITNLGSLKFSQSNRMPDPGDPSRIVTTTTTTTFSMAKEMARSVMQKFLEARFIESADGKNDFASRSAVWQLTPKGMAVLSRFCQRNGITQRHVMDALDSPRNQMQMVILEREVDTDKLYRDQATIEVIFRRFAGQDGPNIKNSVSSSDSDSLSEYASGLVGVRMARDRKIADRLYFNTFTGKATIDWLMDCCTLVDKREVLDLASLFCEYGLIQPVEPPANGPRFIGSKSAIYYITEKGQRVAGWISDPKPQTENGDAASKPREMSAKDSNANRMSVIVRDAALRLLFREYLRSTHCEENLAFYLDVKHFLVGYNAAKRASTTPNFEAIRETLAAAYSLYNAFLAPGSPNELNIDHSLRTALAGRMTRAVGDDDSMIRSLDEVAGLFDQAQVSVFKLMASDSVPKFLRHPKYSALLRERNLDVLLGSR